MCKVKPRLYCNIAIASYRDDTVQAEAKAGFRLAMWQYQALGDKYYVTWQPSMITTLQFMKAFNFRYFCVSLYVSIFKIIRRYLIIILFYILYFCLLIVTFFTIGGCNQSTNQFINRVLLERNTCH